MPLALLFLILLSIILLIGTYLIWKSDLPHNDKIIFIITILALFALVSIVNEAKKSSKEEIKYNLVDLERSFYTQRLAGSEFEYRLPLLTDFDEWIKKSLLDYNMESNETYVFGLMISGTRNGKTLAFQEYAKLLQQNKIPTLYIDIKDTNANIFNLLEYMKLGDINIFEDAIDKFNEDNRIPCIIIDNIQNGFANTIKEFERTKCDICEYLKILYDNKKVNILMITNRYNIRQKLLSSIVTWIYY